MKKRKVLSRPSTDDEIMFSKLTGEEISRRSEEDLKILESYNMAQYSKTPWVTIIIGILTILCLLYFPEILYFIANIIDSIMS